MLVHIKIETMVDLPLLLPSMYISPAMPVDFLELGLELVYLVYFELKADEVLDKLR